jgi:hypothetical protein
MSCNEVSVNTCAAALRLPRKRFGSRHSRDGRIFELSSGQEIPMATKRLMQMGAACAVFVGVVFAARADHFVDTENGNICQAVYSADNPNGTGIFHTTGYISNTSGATRYVVCPINQVQAAASMVLAPGVTATDASGKLWCWTTAFDYLGNTVATASATIPAAISGPQSFSIGSTILEGSIGGYFGLFCVMPPGSSIQMIRNDEDTGGGS